MGIQYEKTEWYNHHARRKIDFQHIIDLIAFDPGISNIGIQVCGEDFQPHIRKITEEYKSNSVLWLSVPSNRLQLWGWRKLLVKRGGKKKVWKPRIVDFWLDENKDLMWKERSKK